MYDPGVVVKEEIRSLNGKKIVRARCEVRFQSMEWVRLFRENWSRYDYTK